MSRQTLPDHLAVEHIEGGEQRRCAMSFEVDQSPVAWFFGDACARADSSGADSPTT